MKVKINGPRIKCPVNNAKCAVCGKYHLMKGMAVVWIDGKPASPVCKEKRDALQDKKV